VNRLFVVAAATVAALVAALGLAATSASTSTAATTATNPPRGGDWITYNPVEPSLVDFVARCQYVKHGTFDPIVMPGMTDRATMHDHTFGGNIGVTNASTEFTLAKTATNCTMSRDRASYWMPTVFTGPGLGSAGTPVYPLDQVRAYYRAATYDTTQIHPIPFGLRMIAGNKDATTPQSAGIFGFQCRNYTNGNTLAKQNTPPDCAPGDYMEISSVFPNCWDGVHLDSADHKSHMSYAKATAVCDAAHPVRLPQLTYAERFLADALDSHITLGAVGGKPRSALTGHADFINAWDPTAMAYFVKNCIQAHLGCGTMEDDRLPPGIPVMGPATFPTGG
jgi:hypothetical protein